MQGATFFNPRAPFPSWQQFLKRPDNVGLNVMQAKQKYLTEQTNYYRMVEPAPLMESAVAGAGSTDTGPTFTNTFSMAFDGVDEFATLNSVPDIAENNCYSISLWFRTSISANASTIFNHTNTGGTALFTLQTRFGTVRLIDALASRVSTTQQLQSNVGAVTNDVRDGEWHHIAVIANTQTNDPTIANDYVADIYLDGYKGTRVTFGSPQTLAGNMASSIRVNNTTYRGEVDEIAFFNKVLTDGGVAANSLAGGDIATLYNSGVTGDIASLNPVVWYRFEEGSGTTISNSGTAGGDGTIDGAAFSTDVPT